MAIQWLIDGFKMALTSKTFQDKGKRLMEKNYSKKFQPLKKDLPRDFAKQISEKHTDIGYHDVIAAFNNKSISVEKLIKVYLAAKDLANETKKKKRRLKQLLTNKKAPRKRNAA